MDKGNEIENYKCEIRRMTENNSDLEYLKGVYTFAKYYQPRNSEKTGNIPHQMARAQ